jgi:microcystin degradation protein MlrC
MRIAVLHFSHETVTFLPNDTELDDFVYPGSPCAGEELLAFDPRGYMGGFVQVAREHEGVELVGIESPLWPKTGTGSGWVTNAAFEHFAGIMIAGLRAQGPFDGAYLCVHGAMAARGVPRPEAELARRVREVLGSKARIVGTFDPHGNEDAEFLRHADMAFTVKYFPHYDMHLQGERAARMLIRSLRGGYRPATVTREIPIISPTVVQWTGAPPWSDLVQRALTWEAREPDVYVNVFFGFPWSDVPDVGMTIQVMTNAKPALAQKIADDMAGFAWRKREALLNTIALFNVHEAVAEAREAAKPMVLADYSDRSGAATFLLCEIVTRNLPRTLIATICDADAVARVVESGAKIGDAFDMEIGGRMDISAGDPVRIQGRIEGFGSGTERASGQSWVHISFGDGGVLILSPFLVQITEPSQLEAAGITLADFDVFVIKSRAHFRRGFDDSGFAKTILLVEPPEPFMGTVRLDALHYENVDLTRFYPYGAPPFPVAE